VTAAKITIDGSTIRKIVWSHNAAYSLATGAKDDDYDQNFCRT